MEMLAEAKDIATCEVTPQHLTLVGPDDYIRLKGYAQMNPPIRDAHHRAALWRAVNQGIPDVIGSDHAPHTKEEKARPYPASPSGMPGVQTIVPVMLTHVANGKMSLERFIELTSAGPQRVFGIAGKGRIAQGYDADFTIVDLHAKKTITDAWSASRCGWTPYDGMEATAWPIATFVRGTLVMMEGALVAPGRGAREVRRDAAARLMVEHRKGLNRALFWLYWGPGRAPMVFRWSMLVFDIVTISIFIFHPLVSWHDSVEAATGVWLAIDVFIAAVITLDFFARLYIERRKWRF